VIPTKRSRPRAAARRRRRPADDEETADASSDVERRQRQLELRAARTATSTICWRAWATTPAARTRAASRERGGAPARDAEMDPDLAELLKSLEG
jgi:hypothetical protein